MQWQIVINLYIRIYAESQFQKSKEKSIYKMLVVEYNTRIDIYTYIQICEVRIYCGKGIGVET